MDVNVNVKRVKNRKRKRHLKLKRREQARLEVRFAKRRKLVLERNGMISKPKDKPANVTQANAFWENYEAAHQWQQRHNVEWWKSRCVALEQENAILRDKIRELVSSSVPSRGAAGSFHVKREVEEDISEGDDGCSDNENLEFQVDEDMMKFFEQSIRHKLELKEKKDVESAMEEAELKLEPPLTGGAAWMQAKTEKAKLLYGDASPRILAMETALQATTDRHKDRARPQFWPNIPLNL